MVTQCCRKNCAWISCLFQRSCWGLDYFIFKF